MRAWACEPGDSLLRAIRQYGRFGDDSRGRVLADGDRGHVDAEDPRWRDERQRLGHLGAVARYQRPPRFGHQRRPVHEVVGVGRDHGDHAGVEQLQGGALGRRTEAADDRARGQLKQAARIDQGLELPGVGHHAAVALGVGDHRHVAVIPEEGHGLLGSSGDLTIWQFEQHHPLAVPVAQDRQLIALGHREAFGKQTHLAAERHLERQVRGREHPAEGLEPRAQRFQRVVPEPRVDMRREDRVRNASVQRERDEFDRLAKRVRSVVDEGEVVTVEVDHRVGPAVEESAGLGSITAGARHNDGRV